MTPPITGPTQSIQIIPPTPSQTPDLTQIPLDPTNPLIWLLILATLLTATEKPLNALANLLRAIAPLLKTTTKNRKNKRKDK